MSDHIYHIYDKVFKKILTLSSKAVINLINGLFDTDYPTDSTITYNWTEFENGELRRILADTILTINGKHSYHMEAQMTEDEDIIFRVFDYGYGHADRNRRYAVNLLTDEEGYIEQTSTESGCELLFPEPKIIYLYSSAKAPDAYHLRLNFGSQGSFLYKVSTFKFLESTLEELNNRKMIILIPFQLLKLRNLMKKERSEENLRALQYLIEHDIIETIEQNLSLNNITIDDARRLKRLTHQLYQHIYSHYEEMEVLNVLTDESLILDIDIIEKRHEEEIAAVVAEKNAEIEALKAENNMLKSTQLLAQKDTEIEALKAEIAALKEAQSNK